MTSDVTSEALNARLIEKMRAEGVLKSPAIAEAFWRVPRHFFLSGVELSRAYQDEAIVTHHSDDGQEWISSSSQPTMMAIMLEQLQVTPGMRVLEIGAGTGYNAALLAVQTGDAGNVWTVDVTAEFCAEARVHLTSAGIEGVHVICADGWLGWPEAAPYDRVIVTASAYDIRPAWFDQLHDGGILLLPWGAPSGPQRAIAFRKQGGGLVQESSRLCQFMRMRGQFEWTVQPSPQESDSWERPWTASPTPIAGNALDDLAFFLSLFLWPLQPIVYWQGEATDFRDVNQPRHLGLMDSTRRIIASVEMGERWKTVGGGDMKVADDLERYVSLWLQIGCPPSERVGLAAYPAGAAPNPKPGELLARREWFDYRVSIY